MSSQRIHALEVTLDADFREHRAAQIAALIRCVPGVAHVSFRITNQTDRHARLRVRDQIAERLVEALASTAQAAHSNELPSESAGEPTCLRVSFATPKGAEAAQRILRALGGTVEPDAESPAEAKARKRIASELHRRLLLICDEVLNGPSLDRHQPAPAPSPTEHAVPMPERMRGSYRERLREEALAKAGQALAAAAGSGTRDVSPHPGWDEVERPAPLGRTRNRGEGPGGPHR